MEFNRNKFELMSQGNMDTTGPGIYKIKGLKGSGSSISEKYHTESCSSQVGNF